MGIYSWYGNCTRCDNLLAKNSHQVGRHPKLLENDPVDMPPGDPTDAETKRMKLWLFNSKIKKNNPL